jgi:hypothetical protein
VNFGVVRLSYDSSFGYTTAAEIPRNLILSHCIVNGQVGSPTFKDSKKGVELNCRECAVLDSYIYNIGSYGSEGHGIDGWKGPGPHIIDNCYVEAPGINVLFGGAGVPDAAAGAFNPQDITCTRSHLKKLNSWVGESGPGGNTVVKNWWEHKNGTRTLLKGCICENMWGGQGQSGYTILMQNAIGEGFPDDQYLYQQVNDVHLIYNKFLSGSGGPNVPATVNNRITGPFVGVDFTPEPITRWKCEHNLFYGIGRDDIGSFGRLYSPTGPGRYVSLDFNTLVLGAGEVVADIHSLLLFAGPTGNHGKYGWPLGARQRGNIVCYGRWGVTGDGTAGNEFLTFAKYDPAFDYSDNVVYGKVPSSTVNDLAANDYFATMAEMVFVDAANGDFHLDTGSPAIGAGPGGADAGADIDQVDIETLHCVDGQWP